MNVFEETKVRLDSLEVVFNYNRPTDNTAIINDRCRNVVAPKDQDPNLVEKMYAEREYVVSKAVEALYGALENGYKFHIPAYCAQELAGYQTQNNSVLKFLADCCVERGKTRDNCTTKKLYDVYREWCRDENGGYAKPKGEFKQILLSQGVTEAKTNGINYFSVTLSLEAKSNYFRTYGYDNLNESG